MHDEYVYEYKYKSDSYFLGCLRTDKLHVLFRYFMFTDSYLCLN